jgi:hypothetical protein
VSYASGATLLCKKALASSVRFMYIEQIEQHMTAGHKMQTGNQAISFGVKSQLAKLLATENLSMRHDPSSKTAWFNVERRELVLPVWQNISEDLYDMLVVHEVGHALDTPMNEWLSGIDQIASKHYDAPTDRNKAAVKGFLNVVEDARIDKRQKRRYPGSRRNFVNGYKELHEKDFFGVAKRDINKLTFIDRANIFFKGGAILNIQFSAEERVFLTRMENAETFDDVISITSDVFGYSIAKKDTNTEKVDDEDFPTKVIITFDEEGDMGDDDEDDDMDDDDFGSFGGATDDEDGEDQDTEDVGPHNKKDEDKVDVDVPDTVKAAEKAAESIVMSDDHKYYYITTPEIDHSLVVDDYKVVFEDMKGCFAYVDHVSKREAREGFIAWRQNEQTIISFMVKEFDMRKAADTYARQSIAKTGVIDTNKIHSYKYNDDIFRRLTTVTDGKNHGFVMFLDWSGSMCGDLNHTMKQLFSLVMFCKRVQVPFDVYLFRDAYIQNGHVLKDRANSNIYFDNFKIRNILSSRMNMQTLNEAFLMLWYMSLSRGLNCDDMNGTPLNSTLLAADYIVNKFRADNKVQIVNTIFLTDGGSDSLGYNFSKIQTSSPTENRVIGQKYFITDHITKKTYACDNINNHRMTEVLLKMLKERTNSNVIGFFITNSVKTVFGLLGINDEETRKSKQESWRLNGYAGFVAAGYDEYYAISVRYDDVPIDDLAISSKMKQNALVKEFMKFSEKKSNNRVLLRSFISRIAA